MEERGLLTREECVEDNRGAVIRVTDAGRKLAGEARVHYEQAVQRYVTDVLTAEQLEALGEIAEAVLTQLDEGHTTSPQPLSANPRTQERGSFRVSLGEGRKAKHSD
jgi:hypothetical protein